MVGRGLGGPGRAPELVQEKAAVTGYQAARAAAAALLGPGAAARVARPLPVEADEPHVAAGRAAARALRPLVTPEMLIR